MKLISKWFFLAAAGVVAIACTPARFTYAPVATTSAEVGGTMAAAYSIPPDDPSGDVHVAVLGVAEVNRPGSIMKERAIRVSLVVSNRSAVTWRVEGDSQHLELTSDRVRVTLDAMTDENGVAKIVDVPARSTRWVELLFVIPEGTDDSLLDSFDVTWTVRAGVATSVTRQTRFEKLRVPPPRQEAVPPPNLYAPIQPLPSSNIPLPGQTFRRAPPPP